MSDHAPPQPRASYAQGPTEEPPEFDEVALQLFRARLVTDLEPAEADMILDIGLQVKKIHELLTEVQQTYHQHKTSLMPEVALRKQIESMVESSLKTQRFTTTFFHLLQELAIDVDTLIGRGGFRDFMISLFVRRFCQDIYEHQLDATSSLIDCKFKMYFRTSSKVIVDDFGAQAHYMSSVETYFYREFKKYAVDILAPEPTDEDIVKLRGLVSCMCFHGVRSLGRLFAHAQYLRRRLEACEHTFLNIWLQLPEEEVARISFPLTLARGALHTTRRNTMTLIALAMRFVHDDEDDRFISYCRAQEDRTAKTADILYSIQDRIDQFLEMIKHFTSDFSAENMKRCASSITVDPIEMRMRQLDLRLVQEGYNVLLVYDGSEDCTELALYLQSEIQERRLSCYLEDIGYDDSEVMSDQTERALDDASVGVFLLTPEFAKRKNKVSQLLHMIHRVRKACVGWPGPTIIPVFYELSLIDCRTGNIFGEGSEAADVDIDKDGVKKAFHYITRYTGIENHEGAKLGDSEESYKRNKGLVRRTADGVAEVCLTTLKEYEEHMQQERNDEISDERREFLEELSDRVTKYRQWQREAREEAFFVRERDAFRAE